MWKLQGWTLSPHGACTKPCSKNSQELLLSFPGEATRIRAQMKDVLVRQLCLLLVCLISLFDSPEMESEASVDRTQGPSGPNIHTRGRGWCGVWYASLCRK